MVATVVTNLTTQAIVHAWDDSTVAPEAVIENVLQALHHPFNGTPTSAIQLQMFGVVKRWWDSKSTEHQAEIRKRTSREAIESNQNHINPENFSRFGSKGPARFEGSEPSTVDPEKTLGEKLLGKLLQHPAIVDGQKVVETLLRMAPTADNPNPIDRALSEFTSQGGDVVQLLEKVPLLDVKAAVGLGNLAKEVIVSQLEEAKRPIDNAVKEVTQAVSGLMTEAAGFFKKPWGF